MQHRHLFASVLCLGLFQAACAAGPVTSSSATGSGGQGTTGVTSGATTGPTSGATTGATTGVTTGGGGDGTPTRQQCTSQFGSAITTTHGRLDGYLVAVVPPGTQGCNGDSGHVHLQVKANGAIYDVAVNTDTLVDDLDAPLPDAAWSEGWHAGMSLDYVANLGVHFSNFQTTNPSALAQKIEGELAQANHISVFATGYGPTGAHDVHRKYAGADGAIVIDPLSAKPHMMLFCFTTPTF